MRLILKLIKVLNSETEPSQISLGLCFGLIAGLTPVLSPHNIIVLFMVTLALVINGVEGRLSDERQAVDVECINVGSR